MSVTSFFRLQTDLSVSLLSPLTCEQDSELIKILHLEK